MSDKRGLLGEEPGLRAELFEANHRFDVVAQVHRAGPLAAACI